jgi:biotin carboxyl carrier protein
VQRKLSFECNGERYDLHLHDLGSRFNLDVKRNGQTHCTLEFEGGAEDGHLWVKTALETRSFRAINTPEGVWLSSKAQVFLARPARAIGASAAETSDLVVRAPMTGRLLAVHVTEGERVKSGQLLAVIEAMKMEYRMEARGPGTIEQVLCRPGDLVNVGAVLIQLAAEPSA